MNVVDLAMKDVFDFHIDLQLRHAFREYLRTGVSMDETLGLKAGGRGEKTARDASFSLARGKALLRLFDALVDEDVAYFATCERVFNLIYADAHIPSPEIQGMVVEIQFYDKMLSRSIATPLALYNSMVNLQSLLK